MADVKTLLVKIDAKTDKLEKGLKKGQKQVSKFGDSVKKVGGIIAAAFSIRAVTRFVSEITKAYDVQAQAENQLLVALKGRTDIQGSLIKQAKELQKTTLFGDEETIQAQALIAAFVKEESHIKRIIPLVQDLAVAKKMQLSVAADLVSKTLGSSTNALSRYGIQVEGAVGSVERLEDLVKGLSNAFEGQAAAAAKVGLGSLTQLKNVYGDLKEVLGENIVASQTFQGIISTTTAYVSATTDALEFANALKQSAFYQEQLNKKLSNYKAIIAALSTFKFVRLGFLGLKAQIGEMAAAKWFPERMLPEQQDALVKPFIQTIAKINKIVPGKKISPIEALIPTEEINEPLGRLKQAMKEVSEETLLLRETFTYTFGDALTNALMSAEQGIEGFFKSLLQSLKQFVIRALALKIASTLANIIFPGSGTLMKGFNFPGIPSFQHGGISTETGLAMVHKNEAHIPLGQNKSLNVNIQGVMRGEDIYWTNKNHEYKLSRVT